MKIKRALIQEAKLTYKKIADDVNKNKASYTESKLSNPLGSNHNGLAGASFSNLNPSPLKAIVKNQTCQIGHSHIPHGSAGCDEEDEEVLFPQFDIFDD
jgi:hypothetical protein